MKTKFRRLLLIPLILTAFFLISFETSASQTNDKKDEPFDIQIEYGIEDVVKLDRTVPVKLTITNQGADFEGRVVLMSFYGDYYSSRYYDNVAYIAEILLPAYETREIWLMVSELSNNDTVIVSIEDNNRKTMYTKEEVVSVTTSSRIYTGIFSDDLSALQFLERGTYTYGPYGESTNFMRIPLSDGSFFEDSRSLELLDMIVISNYDTSQLNEGQYEALKNWVNQGGILLIGTGSTYNKTLSLFKDDYLAGQIGGLSKLEHTFVFQDEMGIFEDVVGRLAIDMLDIAVDGSLMNSEWLYQTVQRGNGKVAVFAFDLTDGQYDSWEYNTDYFYHVMNQFVTEKDWSHFFNNDNQVYSGYWRLRSIISNTFLESIPSIGLYINLLILYVILIPVCYAVLKKIDKRHLMWLTIPAFSVMFGLLIFILGSGTRQKNVFMNYATVVTVNDNLGLEKTYFATTSPRNADYDFQVDGTYLIQPLDTYNYSYYGSSSRSEQRYDIGIDSTPIRTKLEVKNVTAFQTKYFIGERSIDLSGGIKLDISYRLQGYEGTITNESGHDLVDAGLILYRMIIPIGDIKNGESVSLADFVNVNTSSSYSSNIANIIVAEDLDMTIAETGIRTAKRNLLSEEIDVFFNTWYAQEGLFVAFTSDYQPAVGELTKYDVSGYTLLMAYPEIDYWNDGQVLIPDLSSYMEVIEGEVEYYYLPEGPVFYGESVELVYHLDTDMIVDEIGIAYDTYYSEQNIYFYSNEAEDFVQVFESSGTNNGTILTGDLVEYFDEYGRLFVWIENTEYNPDRYYYESYLPIFSISGREQ